MADKQTADETSVAQVGAKVTRRKVLTASAVGIAALAGCSDGSDASNFDGPSREAAEVVEEFYAAYNNQNLEKANALATEEYAKVYELTEEDFEKWGGLDGMHWEIDDMTVERETEEMVEVHAHVTVDTPMGSGKQEDYFIVVNEDGKWRYAEFLPEDDRKDMTEEEIAQRMGWE